MPTFGERLKLLRSERNLTQEELGQHFKMKKSRISQYELNKRQADDELKKSFADYFNVSLDYLLGYSDIRNPYDKSEKIVKSNNMIFGEHLKKLRDEKGITQKDLGNYVGVSDRVIGYYESNDRFPKDENVLKKIAKYFNVSLDYLMGLTDIRNPYNKNDSSKGTKSLGKIISEYREKNNLSLNDFADKVGLDYKYIDALEKETVSTSPALGEICKIAKVMNIPEMDLLEQISYVKPNPKSDKILEKCNDLLEDYIKGHKNDDENAITSKGLYTTLIIKKLFEDGLIGEDGEIDDSYVEMIKASLKTDSKLLNKDKK